MSTIGDPPAVVVSHPKSGRTWLRFMLAHALADTDVRTLHDCAVAVPDVAQLPSPTGVAVTHDPSRLDDAPGGIVLLRDPGEILVSFYFHATEHRTADGFVGDFEDFLASDLGVRALATFLRGLVGCRDESEIVTYDDLSADPAAALARVLRACGRHADSARVDAAAQAGSFERMREVEAIRPINDRFDPTRPNRNRIRVGRADRGAALLDEPGRAMVRDRLRAEVGHALDGLRSRLPVDWAL